MTLHNKNNMTMSHSKQPWWSTVSFSLWTLLILQFCLVQALSFSLLSTSNNNNNNNNNSRTSFTASKAITDAAAAASSSLQQQQDETSSLLLPQKLVGVIFDMDGTLVEPCIDFADMRRRIYAIASQDWGGVPVTEGDVIDIVENERLSPEATAAAQQVFADIEAGAKRDMVLREGTLDLCAFLDKKQIRRAVLTRNVEDSVDYMMNVKMDGLSSRFEPAVARDTVNQWTGQTIPAKPQPDAIEYICQHWNCEPANVIMVGDSDLDDIVTANKAGCGASVLLQTGQDNDSGTAAQSSREERTPTVTIQSMMELHELFEAALAAN